MVHFQTGSFIKTGMFLISMCFITSSAGTIVSLEDRLKELEIKLEMEVYHLKEKNIQLEEKVTQLEAKNAQLENKAQQQETILTSLLLQSKQPKPQTESEIVSNNHQNFIQSTVKSAATPRTCRELWMANPSLPSGMHWIDPDGQGVGENPIYVYCDMTTGSTSIPHDSESPIDVGHCADPGCYSRSINYNASIGQIKALVELSSECHQSIKYDCYYAPFEFVAIPYAWWNDRDGNAQYFWAGNNTDGIHTCQCGIDRNCVDSSTNCNCDAAAPVQLGDDGVITDKNALPITRLNFGRTQLETSSGIHTLGRFQCTGTVALTRMPTSCEDLWLIGHTLNGFYSIMGSAMIESLYCDFTKLPGNDGFQKWIGFTDVKSAPVHFYVQRNSSFTTQHIPISFELELMNEGFAMNLTSGIFTAPRPGIYFFSFAGMPIFPSYTDRVYLGVSLRLNGDQIGSVRVDEANTVAGQWSPLSIQSTLNLKKGDQVWIEIYDYTTGVFLIDDSRHVTFFTGFMLKEEVFASL